MRPAFKAALILGLLGVLLLGGAGLVWAASGGGGEHGGSDQKVWDLVWRTMNFAAVVAVLFFLLRKPLSQALRDRREGIKDELESLEAKRNQVEKELTETLARLDGMTQEKDKILADFQAQGEAERDKILKEAEVMAERIKEQAKLRIEQEVDQARQDLTQEIADLSVARAVELVKENITPDDQDRLVNESLAKMVG